MRVMNLVSGSSGNSTLVGTDRVTVLCDVGVSKKKIEECLGSANFTGADIDAILITHEHIDHVKGLGVFLRKYPVPVYATDRTVEAVFCMNSLGKMDRELFRPFRPGDTIQLRDLEIRSFSVSGMPGPTSCCARRTCRRRSTAWSAPWRTAACPGSGWRATCSIPPWKA